MDTGRTRIVATNLPESRGGGEREAAAGVVWVWGSRGGGKSEKVGWRREGDLLGGKPPAPPSEEEEERLAVPIFPPSPFLEKSI